MKPLVKKLDNIGRVSIPSHVRNHYRITYFSEVEIVELSQGILIKKFNPSCVFCDGTKDLVVIKGKNICVECRKEIVNSDSNRS